MLSLSLENLTTGYDYPVVRANITVEGRRIALVGDNGSGKSTLLRTIGRVIEPLSGTVRLSYPDVSYLGHRPATFPGLDVEDCFEYWRRIFQIDVGIWRDRVQLLLDRWELASIYGVRCDRLSRGQHLLVSLAVSLAQDPQVVVWDEPTSGLDSTRRPKLWDTVSSLIDDRDDSWRLQGVVFSTHLDDDLSGATVLVIVDGLARLASPDGPFAHRGSRCGADAGTGLDGSGAAESGAYQRALDSIIAELRSAG